MKIKILENYLLKIRLSVFLILPIFVNSAYSEITFDRYPSVESAENGLLVKFKVSAPSIVTVEIIESASGSVIRHLASGLLGSRAPSPFTKDSLSQSLLWDRKDDNGVVFTKPYDVRVGIGLNAQLDRFYKPANTCPFTGYITSLLIDSLGNKYYAGSEYRGDARLCAFAKDGSYLRTLIPYPGNLPEQRLKGHGRINLKSGLNPLVYQGSTQAVIPGFCGHSRQQMALTSKGWIIMGSAPHHFFTGNMSPFGRRLLVIGNDGSCAKDTLFGPILTGLSDNISIACDPDGDMAYVTDAGTTIYRQLLDSLVPVRAWVSGLRGVRGMEFGADGKLFVCEWTGNMVKIIDTTTKLAIDSISLFKPEAVKVNRKTGEAYVFCYDTSLTYVNVVKLSATLDSICAIKLTRSYKQRWPSYAVDFSGTTPVVVATALDAYTATAAATDNGTTFSIAPSTSYNAYAKSSYWNPRYMALSPDGKTLYTGNRNWTRFDVVTGAATASKISGTEMAYAPDGTIFVTGPTSMNDNLIWRYDNLEKRIALRNGLQAGTGPSQYCWGPDLGTRGFLIGQNGDFYFHSAHGNPRDNPVTFTPNSNNNNRISHYDSMLVIKDSMIVNLPMQAGGIQVAPDGSIYIGFNAHPLNKTYPFPEISLRMPDPRVAKRAWSYSHMNYYAFYYGSIFRFPSTGGVIGYSTVWPTNMTDPGDSVATLQIDASFKRAFSITGSNWQYYGMSPLANDHDDGDPACVCHTPRFSLDNFGRLFVPDPLTFSVGVIDQSKNELLRIGSYGNFDQLGSTGANPEIPLGFPIAVLYKDGFVYISDIIGSRIARVKIEFDKWATSSGEFHSGPVRGFLSSTNSEHLSISAFPQPFNPRVNFVVSGIKGSKVKGFIYNINGKIIRNFGLNTTRYGQADFVWDGRDSFGISSPAGTYVARFEADNGIASLKIARIK